MCSRFAQSGGSWLEKTCARPRDLVISQRLKVHRLRAHFRRLPPGPMHPSVPSLLVEVRLPMKSLQRRGTKVAPKRKPPPGLQPVPSGCEESRPERCQRSVLSHSGCLCLIWVPCPSRLKLTGLPVCPQLSMGSKSITAWDDDQHRENMQRSAKAKKLSWEMAS